MKVRSLARTLFGLLLLAVLISFVDVEKPIEIFRWVDLFLVLVLILLLHLAVFVSVLKRRFGY